MDRRLFRQLTTVGPQVIEGYKRGMTLAELGELHSCSPGTVRNFLIENGVERRRSGPRKEKSNVDMD